MTKLTFFEVNDILSGGLGALLMECFGNLSIYILKYFRNRFYIRFMKVVVVGLGYVGLSKGTIGAVY